MRKAIILILLTLLPLEALCFQKIDEKTLSFLKELEAQILDCAQRKDTKHQVFTGCMDWHSAVHAHWALFRIARITGVNSAATRWAEQNVNPENLKLVRAEIANSRGFEVPYGLSWYLALSVEFYYWATENNIPEPERFYDSANIAYMTLNMPLYGYYSSKEITPLSGNYKSASWSHYQISRYLNWLADLGIELGSIKEEFDQVLSIFFVRSTYPLLLSSDNPRGDFFSRFGNLAYLIAKTQSKEILDQFLKTYSHTDEELMTIPNVNRNRIGLLWSQAWGLKAISLNTSGDYQKTRFISAYEARVAEGMSLHEKNKSDHFNYGHWVPQFAVYALTEGELDQTIK